MNLSNQAEMVANNLEVLLANQIRVAQWALDEWWESKDPNYLIAFERMAEKIQLTAGKLSAYERLANGETFDV